MNTRLYTSTVKFGQYEHTDRVKYVPTYTSGKIGTPPQGFFSTISSANYEVTLVNGLEITANTMAALEAAATFFSSKISTIFKRYTGGRPYMTTYHTLTQHASMLREAHKTFSRARVEPAQKAWFKYQNLRKTQGTVAVYDAQPRIDLFQSFHVNDDVWSSFTF